ncbi:MAG: helix-turn-helix domain-containing protein [Proteobacteria bacterium]|nr:helix-turn-helix domain-containing protein [Pseudomonadota bacterium]
MRDNNNLGNKIRAQRKSLGWTLRDLAERLGVSVMTVQRIETGKVSPSVSMLQDVAHALDRPLHGFLPDESPEMRVISRNDIPVEDNGLSRRIEIIPPGLISNDVTITLSSYRAGTVVGPNQSNAFEGRHVLDGQQELLYRGKKVTIKPGDTVVYDASFKHTVTAVTDSTTLVFTKNTA